MERKDMIKRLYAGEKAIDLSIEKFEDMLAGTGIDDGGANCACCYMDNGEYCSTCSIHRYEEEKHIPGSSRLCCTLPSETDEEGIKEAIKYIKRVKQWMIEKGEY